MKYLLLLGQLLLLVFLFFFLKSNWPHAVFFTDGSRSLEGLLSLSTDKEEHRANVRYVLCSCVASEVVQQSSIVYM